MSDLQQNYHKHILSRFPGTTLSDILNDHIFTFRNSVFRRLEQTHRSKQCEVEISPRWNLSTAVEWKIGSLPIFQWKTPRCIWLETRTVQTWMVKWNAMIRLSKTQYPAIYPVEIALEWKGPQCTWLERNMEHGTPLLRFSISRNKPAIGFDLCKLESRNMLIEL